MLRAVFTTLKPSLVLVLCPGSIGSSCEWCAKHDRVSRRGFSFKSTGTTPSGLVMIPLAAYQLKLTMGKDHYHLSRVLQTTSSQKARVRRVNSVGKLIDFLSLR
jgi:hypothetical protein